MNQKRHKARKAKRRAWHMKYTAPGPARDKRRDAVDPDRVGEFGRSREARRA